MISIETKLKELIMAYVNGIEVSDITNSTNLIQDLGFDSVDIVQLIIEIESLFDIEIEDELLRLEMVSTYTGLVEILRKKICEEETCL